MQVTYQNMVAWNLTFINLELTRQKDRDGKDFDVFL